MANGSLHKEDNNCSSTESALQALKDACFSSSGCIEEECTTHNCGDGEEELSAIVQQSLVMDPKFSDKSHNQMVQQSKKKSASNAVYYQMRKVKKHDTKDAKASKGKKTSAQTSKTSKKTNAQTSKTVKNTIAQTSKKENTSAQTNKEQQVDNKVTCTNDGQQQKKNSTTQRIQIMFQSAHKRCRLWDIKDIGSQ